MKSELAKLLEVLVREVGSISPMAFTGVNLQEAIRQADEIAQAAQREREAKRGE